ncbi:hypothetical protein [Chondromyces apiculatus]|uniref:Putative ATP-dependent DNA helicase n=1 Tax=Chondromyces apiculatus DSM 436 TaxID=1192034 RepID=A0A017STQ9_9BACT|nr:hypothetical protein [Chondromyces apiculatus]EYF00378.1 Putative ATP-dependent DNA helicase [Chondromyces apiculatus DSM 436]
MVKKKRRALQAPFIVTVAATSALLMPLLPGCGSSVSGDCTGGGCNPPLPTEEGCPETAPPDGLPCAEVNLNCYYPDSSCPEFTTQCNSEGRWETSDVIVSCNPPEPDWCPAEMPMQGTPCSAPEGIECTYMTPTGCGDMESYATCHEGAWVVSLTTCNPPSPDYCLGLSEQDCSVNADICRWLEPGCAEPGGPQPALEQAGCHPLGECMEAYGCFDDTICAERVINPCAGMACDACGQVQMLCVPSAPDQP